MSQSTVQIWVENFALKLTSMILRPWFIFLKLWFSGTQSCQRFIYFFCLFKFLNCALVLTPGLWITNLNLIHYTFHCLHCDSLHIHAAWIVKTDLSISLLFGHFHFLAFRYYQLASIIGLQENVIPYTHTLSTGLLCFFLDIGIKWNNWLNTEGGVGYVMHVQVERVMYAVTWAQSWLHLQLLRDAELEAIKNN